MNKKSMREQGNTPDEKLKGCCYKSQLFLCLLVSLFSIAEGTSEFGMIAYFEESCPNGWEEHKLSAGRVIIGKGNVIDSKGDSKIFTPGTMGGEFSHTLTIPEVPNHHHTTGINGWLNRYGGGEYIENCSAVPGGGPHYGDANTSSVGEGKSFNIMQPYIVLVACKCITNSTQSSQSTSQQGSQSQSGQDQIDLLTKKLSDVQTQLQGLLDRLFDISKNQLDIKQDLDNKLLDVSKNQFVIQQDLENKLSKLSQNQSDLSNNLNDVSNNQLNIKQDLENKLLKISQNQSDIQSNLFDVSKNQLGIKQDFQNKLLDVSKNQLNIKQDLENKLLNVTNFQSDMTNNLKDISRNQEDIKQNLENNLESRNSLDFKSDLEKKLDTLKSQMDMKENKDERNQNVYAATVFSTASICIGVIIFFISKVVKTKQDQGKIHAFDPERRPFRGQKDSTEQK